MNSKLSSLLISIAILQLGLLGVCNGEKLRQKYYEHTCPQVLDIVREVTWKHVAQDLTLAAPLLRLHFHDCFVRAARMEASGVLYLEVFFTEGCDASILLDSTANNTAEKDAIPNLTLDGFDIISNIKTAVEKACPGVVSCADIVALAARDSVSFQYKRPLWKVLLGRRDGTISHVFEALANIVPPTFTFTQLKQSFASKGLDVRDLVVLSGAHTIGESHCPSFTPRLYNFTEKGGEDPSLNPRYAAYLKTKCKSLSDNTTSIAMDPGSSVSFDNHYYKILLENEGLFQSDAVLLTDKKSLEEVKKLLISRNFFKEFAKSIRKMGAIQVLTGTEGEIRKNCSVVNS